MDGRDLKSKPLFTSYLMGGFECSTHRRFDGRRLDMIEATCHERFADEDYQRLADLGMTTARDGLRWHLIESKPGGYDFSSVERQVDAAEKAGVQVMWDLFHYGYPDYLDIFSSEFIDRYAAYAIAFAEFYVGRTGKAPAVLPVNEISFFSYVGGDVGHFYPFVVDRGVELKRQLVRAAIAGIQAVRDVAPRARIISAEPAVHVLPRLDDPEMFAQAESFRLSQYQAFDMLTGRIEPELGGRPEYLDVVGINYYPHNQWFYPDREMIPVDDELYRPLHLILLEVYERYRRPMFLSETGTEDDIRAKWFNYVATECETARRRGVDLRGICLYPIVDHPGWLDERHCKNGLWGYCDEKGEREIHTPLVEAFRKFEKPEIALCAVSGR